MTDKQIMLTQAFSNLRRRIKKLGEKCIETQKENNKLKSQLKRKEQECEELIKNYFTVIQQRNVAEQQLDKLKAELEQEKNWHKIADEISKVNSEYTAKLKATLQDIKEIAQYDVYTSHTDLCIKLNWVKKKISEVIPNEN